MRWLPWRRSRSLHSSRDFRAVLRAANLKGGEAGIDSLNILAATLDDRGAAGLLTDLGADLQAIRAAARSPSAIDGEAPGLTDDAKRVIEAAGGRALGRRRGPDARELLIGLASADCQARRLLNDHGIDRERLIAAAGRRIDEPAPH